MDVIIARDRTLDNPRPWSWQVVPGGPPLAPSAPRSRFGFVDCEEAEQDAQKEGHTVREVRE